MPTNKELEKTVASLAESVGHIVDAVAGIKDDIAELKSAPAPAPAGESDTEAEINEQMIGELVRKNQANPRDETILNALKELVDKVGENRTGLFRKLDQGKQIDNDFSPDNYDVFKVAEEMAIKNGFRLGGNWREVYKHFWSNRCVDTGAYCWVRWRYQKKGDYWHPEIGGRIQWPRERVQELKDLRPGERMADREDRKERAANEVIKSGGMLNAVEPENVRR